MSTSLVEIEKMGNIIHTSGLFGYKNPEEVMALLMIADAEGIHPAMAMRRYHIIQGRPTIRSDAMLADFMERGGKVEWHDATNTKAEATFIAGNGNTVKSSFTIEDAERAGLCGKGGIKLFGQDKNGSWQKHPDAMLRARLISKAIRMVDPACVCGIYTPEELGADVDGEGAPKEPERVNVTPKDAPIVGIDEPKLQYQKITADRADTLAILRSMMNESDDTLSIQLLAINDKYANMYHCKFENLSDVQLERVLDEYEKTYQAYCKEHPIKEGQA